MFVAIYFYFFGLDKSVSEILRIKLCFLPFSDSSSSDEYTKAKCFIRDLFIVSIVLIFQYFNLKGGYKTTCAKSVQLERKKYDSKNSLFSRLKTKIIFLFLIVVILYYLQRPFLITFLIISTLENVRK